MVVGTKKATWHPSITALNAARIAISVFPYPTSPQIKRSIMRLLSISSFVASIAFNWSSVSSYGKSSSNSFCQTVSFSKQWPFFACLLAYSSTSSPAISLTAPFTLVLVFFHSGEFKRFSFGTLASLPAYFCSTSSDVAGTYKLLPAAYATLR